jgi:hypothetical protein
VAFVDYQERKMFKRPGISLLFLLFPLPFLLSACQYLPGFQLPTPATPVTLPPEEETPILMCTAPACEANEVFFCEGECPGGCNTTCATVTPSAVTVPPQTEETPFPMCTPPACEADEVFFCAGDCPGGCGTTCATITPPATSGGATAPADWAGLEGWLTDAWVSVMDVAAVRAGLQAAGWQTGEEMWQTADLDGDLRDEWILTLYDPAIPADALGRVGNLWVVNGNGVIYRFYETVGSDLFDFATPAVVGVVDMTGDGLVELVVNKQTCGANTCFGNYQVLSYREGGLHSLVSRPSQAEGDPTNTISISYPDTRFEDVNQDGVSEFLVHGGNVGSAGAGVVRTRTEVWAWDGTAVTLRETRLDPTEYRHHILYEANDLMAAGQLEQALALYEQAVNDGALLTAPFTMTEAETKAAIDQFAAFRLILIDLLRNDAARAASRLAWLQGNYPDSAAAQGAAVLVSGWSGIAGQEALCNQIETTLAGLPNPTGALADMGFGNPSLGAEHYCP